MSLILQFSMICFSDVAIVLQKLFTLCRLVIMLLHGTCSGPVQKQSKSSVAFSKVHIYRRAAVTNEFLMSPDSYTSLITNDQKEMVSTYIQHGHYEYELVCPKQVSTGSNDPPNKRSTCPWYYRVKHNPKQYPAMIMNAERLCEYSIGSNNSFECVPITQKFSVLELQNYMDDNDNYVWTNTMVTVVIGYTSAGRRSDYSFGTKNYVGTPAPEFD
ncbi:uncharacterized protein LOC123523779 [Mercenaria mercenaria]|uniref:uncharacterized protein LOC123523779 n=1 Tax=Mercenaria mercenaria TaxID=6596 RepID=UPI00234FAF91|nr:uncharacterized protein LOC123523779 [Mercenaria mercenaria]